MATVIAGLLHRQFFSEPPVPATSFKGKTVIVTGGNSGLGLEASRWFVRLGAQKVILACRNVTKGEGAAKDIQASESCPKEALEVWQLDMNSHASVKAFANKVNSDVSRLDAFVANAGVMCPEFRLVEGNEETINCNVIATILLGFLVQPKLRETAKHHNTYCHFTIVGSDLYAVASFKESKCQSGTPIFTVLNEEKRSNMGDRYNVSKLLTLLMTRQMAEMLPLQKNNVIIDSVGPGYCQSNLQRDAKISPMQMKIQNAVARTTEEGARTLVGGASAGPECHGEYMPDCKVVAPGALAKGKKGRELQARVWTELREKLEEIQPGVTSL